MASENLPNGNIELQAVALPTRKRRGEASEAAFLARATHFGFTVCLPWGDSERYDSVVELGQGFLRVQVKSAARYAESRYRVKTAGASGVTYTASEIDFFVAHIVPEDIWYIIPIKAIGHRKGIRFYPHTSAQISRPIRKIPRSLVSAGVHAKSSRLERHPRNLPMQSPSRPLRRLPKSLNRSACPSFVPG